MKLRIGVDPDNALARSFTALERQQLPFAAMQAANATAWEIRQRWAEIMPRVFDRPTPLTMRAVVYEKATKSKPYAVVKIRDEAFKGTPPAKYLQAQVYGGSRATKAFEKRLQAAGLMPAGMQAVPGRGAQLDAFGNIAGSQMNKILSQLGARFDPLQNETAESRARRQRREAKRGDRRGDYFAVPKQSKGLRPGIYQRVRTGFGSAVRIIMAFVRPATYKARYPIFQLAERMYAQIFKFQLERELAKAVENAKFKGGSL
jgi:hypothetical protein